MKRVLLSIILLFCVHVLAVKAQYHASSIYSSEWVVFDDEELEAFEIDMEMSATPTEICFKTIYDVGDTVIGKAPYYLIDVAPVQFVSNLVGKSLTGKYIVIDASRGRADGVIEAGKFIVFVIKKLNATEMYLETESGYIQKYKRK